MGRQIDRWVLSVFDRVPAVRGFSTRGLGNGAMSRRVTTPPELLIVQNARVFDPGQQLDERADVVIEAGLLTRLGPGAGAEPSRHPRARVIDGRGAWVLPGFIDLRAYLGDGEAV